MLKRILVLFLFVISISIGQLNSQCSGVIDVCPPKEYCDGNVVLSGLTASTTVKIIASKLRTNIKTERKKRSIQKTHFEIAKVEGNCRWKAWSAKRGGSFHLLESDLKNGFSDPGFVIRAVELLE